MQASLYEQTEVCPSYYSSSDFAAWMGEVEPSTSRKQEACSVEISRRNCFITSNVQICKQYAIFRIFSSTSSTWSCSSLAFRSSSCSRLHCFLCLHFRSCKIMNCKVGVSLSLFYHHLTICNNSVFVILLFIHTFTYPVFCCSCPGQQSAPDWKCSLRGD